MIIGITGGIGTGKSFIASYIKKRGYSVISSDKIARELMKQGNQNYKNILNAFGRDILWANEDINRKKLGEMIFSNKVNRDTLNKITHPNIIEELKKRSMLHELVFLEIALLFEAKVEYLIDQIWVVTCSDTAQVKRLVKRDGITKKEALLKIKSQYTLKEKIKNADVIINTNKDRKEIYKKIDQLLNRLENKE